jgi:hypothetical protein
VCFDGLPYDYEAVQLKDMEKRIGTGFFWGETTGPGAYGTSEMAHEQFDRLSGIDPSRRTREDRLPISLLSTIEQWLDDRSGRPEGMEPCLSRSRGRAGCQGEDCGSSRDSGQTHEHDKGDVQGDRSRVSVHPVPRRSLGSLAPVPQYPIFEKLNKPIMQAGGEDAAWKVWHQHSDERDRYLEGIEDALITQGYN